VQFKIDAGIIKILEVLRMEYTFSIHGGHDLHGEMYGSNTWPPHHPCAGT
jgi:hypothetical protein